MKFWFPLLLSLCAPLFCQQEISIPKPVAGWEKTINGAPANSVIRLGPGRFETKVPLHISNPNIVLAGAGARMTEIVAAAKMPVLLDSTSRIVSLRDLVLDGNHLAEVDLHALKPTYPDTRPIEAIEVVGALEDGAVIEACQLCTIVGISASQNGRDGVVLSGCNGCDVRAITAQFNGGRGVVIQKYYDGKDTFSGGMTATEINAESNQGTQFEVVSTSTAIVIINPWIEGGPEGVDGLRISAPHVTVVGGRISGKAKSSAAAAVRLLGLGRETVITGTQYANEAGNFARVAR